MKIAIIGVGLRFPPNCNSLHTLWHFLQSGGDAIAPVPVDRWDPRRFADKDPDRPGKTYVAKGGYLQDSPKLFDPAVFGISPREAQGLDPQQRLLLETTWEAFEDGGIPLEAQEGAKTGVFVGGFCLDHLLQINHPANRSLASSHSATSATMTVLSNRLSYAFNLRGPSFTLDTACSSSLVALHCACQSLRTGESTMALAGGVNIMMRPEFPIMMSKGRFLSDHANCRAFDASAAGYVRGEGGAMLLLKPLEAAEADGDLVHAVIEGSGVNQDGRTSGISLPSSEAQEALMREVYTGAGVLPASVDYVEAHGTGTQAGDPLEARALDAVFREGREPANKLWVGSIKTNFGHTEAAAGVAGVIKALLVLKHRKVPQNLHFKEPNPKIPFQDYRIQIATALETLPAATEKEVLYAGVNSFGYGGTNAHVVLASAPASETAAAAADADPDFTLFPLSARSPEALRESASRLAFFIRRNKDASIRDLFHTLTRRRSQLGYRMGIIAADTTELRKKLMLASNGEEQSGIRIGKAPVEATKPVFVFTGMGPQWWAMGRELFLEEPVCAATLDEVEAIFKPLSGWSLKEAILADEASSPMMRTEVAQPANMVIQLALTRLWAQWGIEPAAVIGHSVGEVVSALIAGVYTLEEAVTVSYHRSRLQAKEAGKGGMLAVGLPETDAMELLKGREGVSLAAENSFSAVVLAGDSKVLEEIAAELAEREVFHKALRVEVAYHSPQMDPVNGPIQEALAGLRPKPAAIPLVSTVSGAFSTGTEWTGDYWWHNVRQPVRFAEGVRTLISEGHALFLEVGPHPVLGNSIQEVAADSNKSCQCLFSLRRKEPEQASLQNTLAALFTQGVCPDWAATGPGDGRFIRLPGYAWQRQPYWMESADSEMDRLGLAGPVYMNQRIHGAQPTWSVEINEAFFPFLHDHGVQGQTVFPGMGYVASALALHQTVAGGSACCLRDVDFEKVLIVDRRNLQQLLSSVDPQSGAFTVSSRAEGHHGDPERHARGHFSARPETEDGDLQQNPAVWRESCPKPVEIDWLYEKLSRRGLYYGTTFRPTRALWSGRSCFFAEIEAPDPYDGSVGPLHPALLDAALQPVLYIAKGERLFVPTSIGKLSYTGRIYGDQLYAFGELTREESSYLEANVYLCATNGQVIASIEGIACQQIEGQDEVDGDENRIYLPEWREEVLAENEIRNEDVAPLCLLGHSAAAWEASVGAQLVEKGVQAPNEKDTTALLAKLPPLEVQPEAVFLLPVGAPESADDAGIIAYLEMQLAFFQALAAADRPIRLVLFGRIDATETNLRLASLAALALTTQNECDHLRILTLHLAEADPNGAAEQILREIAAGSSGEILCGAGQRAVRSMPRRKPRAAALSMRSVSVDQAVRLATAVSGKLADLHFLPDTRRAPAAGEIEVRIEAAALNYKDLLKLYGRLDPIVLRDTYFGTTLGMEACGRVLSVGPDCRHGLMAGDRVLMLLPSGFRSQATIPETFVVQAPEKLGIEAASLPVVYLTALHGLETVARLGKGERVLIHQASGGLGLAAIDVARKCGADIFATAGSETKRAALRELGIEQVFPSRDLSFVEGVLQATGGEGVDVVLSAQVGAAQRESLTLLRPGGRFIDVGKKDILDDSGLPLRAFNRNLTFAAIDIDRLLLERPDYIRELMHTIVRGFASGELKGIETECFPAAEVAAAFNRMAQSQHTGKILLDFRSGEVEVPARAAVPGTIRSKGAYLVTGGTAGFGLASAHWLAQRGAGRIVLLSRRGEATPGLAEARSQLEDEGASLVVVQGDVTAAEDLKKAKAVMHSDGFEPAGVIHGAMVLDDAFLADLDPSRFRQVLGPKVLGALRLAEIFEDADLDFLVFYSSISALIGNRGQASYVVANAFLDAFAHQLRAKGRNAVSINWGAIAETGVVARSEVLAHSLEASGVHGLSTKSAFNAMEQILAGDVAQAAVIDVDWKLWAASNPKLAEDPRFREHVSSGGHGLTNETARALLSEIEALDPADQGLRLEQKVQAVVAEVLKTPTEDLNPAAKLSDMGVDSLLMMELSLNMKEKTGIAFTAMDFLKGPSIGDLADELRKRLFQP